jgi:hypothetical protein
MEAYIQIIEEIKKKKAVEKRLADLAKAEKEAEEKRLADLAKAEKEAEQRRIIENRERREAKRLLKEAKLRDERQKKERDDPLGAAEEVGFFKRKFLGTSSIDRNRINLVTEIAVIAILEDDDLNDEDQYWLEKWLEYGDFWVEYNKANLLSRALTIGLGTEALVNELDISKAPGEKWYGINVTEWSVSTDKKSGLVDFFGFRFDEFNERKVLKVLTDQCKIRDWKRLFDSYGDKLSIKGTSYLCKDAHIGFSSKRIGVYRAPVAYVDNIRR